MSKQGFYPEYYLKKRQRDASFSRIWKIVFGVVVVAVGIGIGVVLYTQVVVNWRKPPENTEQLAGLKGELETEKRLQNAAEQTQPNDAADAAKQVASQAKLEDVAYVQSFPQIHVSVTGSNLPINRGPTEADPVPDATDSGGDEAQQTTAGDPDPGSGSTGATAAGNTPSAQEKTREAPADDPPKQEEQPKPAKAAHEYKIYAGSYPTQSAADEGKRGLGSIGLTGTILRNGADYNLLVGTMSDYDAALALREKLLTSGYAGSFVTRKTR